MNSKKLGLGSAISICVGLIVATSCLLSLGLGFGLAGKGFILSMLVVVVLNAFQAISFGELHSLMPEVDGGLGQYTKVGLGPVASIVSNTSAYLVVNLLAASVEISMCGMVINQIFLPSVPPALISIAFLVLLTLVNYLGIDIFAKVQNIVVILLIGSLFAFGIIGYFKLGTGTVIDAAHQTAPVVSGFGGVLGLSALAFWLFIGIEFVIPIAKNLKNPKRDVMLSMVLGILILFVVQSLLGSAMTNYVTLEDLASSSMPHMLFAENMLGTFGVMWMGFVSVCAAISTVNTVLGSVSRILGGMAENDMLPAVFAKKNTKGAPVAGLLLLTIGNIILILSGFTSASSFTNILLAASCFWLTSYILVNMTVLILRRRYPNHPARNKKLLFFGIPQIICMIGDVYMIWNIAEGDDRIFIYKLFFIILAALVAYAVIWIKFVKKIPLFKSSDMIQMNEYAVELDRKEQLKLKPQFDAAE